MSRYFMYGTSLQDSERIMMSVPNFLPRTKGMIIMGMTITQKILAAHAGLPSVTAGQLNALVARIEALEQGGGLPAGVLTDSNGNALTDSNGNYLTGA